MIDEKIDTGGTPPLGQTLYANTNLRTPENADSIPSDISKDAPQAINLVSSSEKKSRPLFGSADGLITISENFEETEDFEEYM